MPDSSPIRNDSLGNGKASAAPGAGVALATLVAPPAGYYQVEIWCGLSGTLAAADATNFEFRKGASVVTALAYSANATGGPSNATAGPYRLFVNLDGATNITVNATANSTASSVYHCTMIATKQN